MKNKIQIHQIHPSVSYGDAIGNEMVEIQNILRQLGYDTNIYAQYIHPKMSGINHYTEYEKSSSSDNILIIHFSIGYGPDLLSFIRSLPDKKILLYHNITPHQYFCNINSDYEYYTKIGREELKDFINLVDLALGDSEFNRQELVELGFKNTGVLPIIIDFNKYKITESKCITNMYNDNYINILFVGRVSPNKNIEDIIKTFYYYQKINSMSRLFLVGSKEGMDNYYNYLTDLIAKLDIENIYFTDHIYFEELISYFKLADIFLVMSEHEGFCVPLLESMFFEIPIVAYKSTAIPYTLGDSGILVNEKRYDEIAEMLNLIVEDEVLKETIIKKQRERLGDFSIEQIVTKLKSYLDQVLDNKIDKPSIRIEGTFEDSYSLSIVNRNLALALDDLGYNVSLFATTGHGDYLPPESQITDERVKKLWLNEMINPDYVIRNIYPPRTKDIVGKHRLINFYWEESLIPKSWVADFNSLDGIIVATKFVKKVLRDSGVKTRIGIVPPGVDIDLFTRNINPMKIDTEKKFVFLNIGSGFPRKGVDVLLKAYTDEFTNDDNICLLLKTFPNIHNNILEQVKAVSRQNGPEIILIDDDLPEEEMVALYKCCNCFVSPTRGEGFGLPIAEAMLCKMPVIVTGYGGHLDFCNEDNSYLIRSVLEPSRSHLKAEHSIEGSMWAEPNAEHLRQLMRHVYENWGSIEIREKIDASYKNITTNYNWESSARKTIELLNRISSKIKLGMVTTWDTKCGIAEYSEYITEHLHSDLEVIILSNHVEPRELVRQEEHNVIRCWNLYFDDLNQLFEKILDNRLDIVHFQFNFGFFELNSLAYLIRRLNLRNIKTIITFHSVDDTEMQGEKISLKYISDDLRLVDLIWVHTSDARMKLSNIGIDENVIQIPIGNKVFRDIDKYLIRSGTYPNTIIISTFGFFLPHKGILEIIRALPELIKRWPDILFLVVSALYPNPISNEYYKRCKRETEQLNLENNVVFIIDFLEDHECMELLQASDIVVMPYHETKESASAAIRFALASHRPVIVTDISIFKEFEDEVYKIKACSPDLIAKGIIELYGNEKRRNEIVISAEELTERNRWENIANRYINMLNLCSYE